jgi:hypothetical protein
MAAGGLVRTLRTFVLEAPSRIELELELDDELEEEAEEVLEEEAEEVLEAVSPGNTEGWFSIAITSWASPSS